MVWQYAKIHTLFLRLPRRKIEFAILPYYAIDIRLLPGERLHQQQAMENEGAMGLTHRSCFRVAAAPTLATKRSYELQDHFGRSPVLWGALVVGMRNADHYQCT
jgi:hypothetical protein